MYSVAFLSLELRKDLEGRVEGGGHEFEWADIKQELKALEEVVIEDNGRSLALRTQCIGTCGRLFQAVGVAVRPTIREV
jgi:hypothetical protein